MTEKAFFGWIRSTLRRSSQRWRPIYQCLNAAKRSVSKDDTIKHGNRIKFVYECAVCHDSFPKKLVEVDHVVPCGSLKSFEDIGPFVERMLCEADGLRILCKSCHLEITHDEAERRRSEAE